MAPEVVFVSSHDESCGIAYFTDQLVADIAPMVPCKVIPLDLSLTRSTIKPIRRLADAHIKSICDSISLHEYVNIQIEWGLFGVIPEDVSRRLKWLISANPRSVVTLHTTGFIQPVPRLREIIKRILKLNFIDAYHIARERRNVVRTVSAYCSVISEIKLHNAPIIVHTERARKQIKTLFQYENVHVHPLSFPYCNFETKKYGEDLLHSIKASLNIPNGSLSVGLFGFISRYKGHDDAVRAINNLPRKYHLFVFGRQHPQTIRSDGGVDYYISDLMSLIDDLGLHSRVHFLGEFSSKDFMALISAVDVAWLPYHEVGQEGSAVAAQCIAGGKRVVCSASYAFDEMLKLDPKAYIVRVDIGNYNNLASATEMVVGDDRFVNDYSSGRYSAQTQRDMYLNLMGFHGSS